ncbi:hypothetical protein, partial [Komagataeibacter europaeus]|uniref:hypothetical protein n=1 Tax=Komagataeibacter europaeus TaxID=33995 RepID=UPI001C71391B
KKIRQATQTSLTQSRPPVIIPKDNNRAASISLPDTLSILLSKNPPERCCRPVKGLLRILAPPVNANAKTHEMHGNQPIKP